MVSLQYRVLGGTAASGSGVFINAMGRFMVIVYFFSVSVTGSVPGGRLARGHHLTLKTSSVGHWWGLQYSYHTWQ